MNSADIAGVEPVLLPELLRKHRPSAAEAMPDDIGAMMRSRFMLVDGPHEPRFDIEKAGDGPEGWLVRVAGGERSKRSGHLISPDELKAREDLPSHFGAFTPGWSSLVPLPQISPRLTGRSLRTIDGRLVTPHSNDGIIDGDSRTPFIPQGHWRSVGAIVIGGQVMSYGSGVLVGPDLVLTAAHVVPEGFYGGGFAPGYSDLYDSYGEDGSFGHDPIEIIDFVKFDMGDDLVSAWDLAVVRLDRPVGFALGWWGVVSYPSSLNGYPLWHQVGYPGSDRTQPYWEGNVTVHASAWDGPAVELYHRADMTNGQSGGPLAGFFSKTNAAGIKIYTPTVIGVASGSAGGPAWWEEHNISAGGLAMVCLVEYARKLWPRPRAPWFNDLITKYQPATGS